MTFICVNTECARYRIPYGVLPGSDEEETLVYVCQDCGHEVEIGGAPVLDYEGP